MCVQSQPTISVIIPTYNRAGVLGRSIKSVLAQTYCDFELLVVDDGSTDNTDEVMKSFNDPRICFLKHEKNRGFPAALNTGIKAARGEYIAFQDSDDEWLPAKLERQMALFKQDDKGDLGLVLCEVLATDGRGDLRIIPRLDLLSYEKLLPHRRDGGYCTIQLLIKRELAGIELHMDENLTASLEWDLLVRLSRLCRFDYVPEVLAKIHTSDDGMTQNKTARLNASLKILEKYLDELKARPEALGSNYFDIALKTYHAGLAMRCMRRYILAAISVYPWRPTPYFALIFSLFGRPGIRLLLKLYKILENFQ